MTRRNPKESGQAVIEMGLILLALLSVTAGLIDVGRAIFVYNEVAGVARYGVRWASVVGGTCVSPATTPNKDWCYPASPPTGSCVSQVANFWCETGNRPLEGAGAECDPYTTTPGDWYTVGQYVNSSAPTIVGALAQHLDTGSGSSGTTVVGSFTPGMDLNKLEVCIELSGSSPPAPGDQVTVNVYYPFTPAGGLFGNQIVPLSAESQWQVE